ncbi:MAG: polymer-forming cytoskeletal protein [Chloroflexota bacterium]|nr:polymer-forming cytoskeletal protein [Chloroflexota bacterium]
MNPVILRKRRLWMVLGLVLAMVLIIVSTVGAFEGRGGDVVVIATDEVIKDDLYVGAETFTLNGTVEGDLIVAGGTIEINGIVKGDLLAVGQSVTINGEVQDDARIAGYALFLGGEIGDDLLGGGFSLETRPESRVGGDLFFGGYQGALAGAVDGNLNIGGGAVKLAGEIEGDVVVDVSGSEPGEGMPPGFPFAPGMPSVPSVPAGLTLAKDVRIGGDLQYTANVEGDIPAGVVAGRTSFTPYTPDEQVEEQIPPLLRVGKWLFKQLQRLITLLLLGALMLWLAPNWTRNVADVAQERPLASFGGGVIALAVFGLGMMLLLGAIVLLVVLLGVVTLGELAGLAAAFGGLMIGALGLSFKVVWSYVTKIIISVLVGRLILARFAAKVADNRWWPLLVGVLLWVLVTAIPLLGWLVGLVLVLLGLGAILLWGYDRWQGRRVAAPSAAPSTVEEAQPLVE